MLCLTFVPLTSEFISDHQVFFARPRRQAHSGAAQTLSGDQQRNEELDIL